MVSFFPGTNKFFLKALCREIALKHFGLYFPHPIHTLILPTTSNVLNPVTKMFYEEREYLKIYLCSYFLWNFTARSACVEIIDNADSAFIFG